MASTVTNTEKTRKAEAAPASDSMPKAEVVARHRDLPFSLGRLRDEFDRVMDRLATTWPGLLSGLEGNWRWGLDVEDKGDTIVVHAEAPGFEPEDFDIQVQDGQLTLRAEKKAESKREGGRERNRRQCHQSVSIPGGVDKDKVEANYRNGVLTITLPKTAEAKTRKVAVKAT